MVKSLTNKRFIHFGRFKLLYKKYILLIILLTPFVVVLAPTTAEAHNPTDVTMEYDFWEDEVYLYIIHEVSNPETHYISSISILRNDMPVASRYYDHQNDTWGMSDTFDVTAFAGDNLTAYIHCSEGGYAWTSLIVSEPTTEPEDTDETQDTTSTNYLFGLSSFQIAMAILLFSGCIILGCLWCAWEKIMS
jgi:hypothetical protein